MVRNHQEAVGHRTGRLLLPAAPGEALILRSEVVLDTAGRPGRLGEDSPEPLVSLSGLPRLWLAGALVIPGTEAGPGATVAIRGEHGQSTPTSAVGASAVAGRSCWW